MDKRNELVNEIKSLLDSLSAKGNLLAVGKLDQGQGSKFIEDSRSLYEKLIQLDFLSSMENEIQNRLAEEKKENELIAKRLLDQEREELKRKEAELEKRKLDIVTSSKNMEGTSSSSEPASEKALKSEIKKEASDPGSSPDLKQFALKDDISDVENNPGDHGTPLVQVLPGMSSDASGSSNVTPVKLGINDRMLFQRALFNNDAKGLNDFLFLLNEAPDLKGSLEIIERFKSIHKWREDDEAFLEMSSMNKVRFK